MINCPVCKEPITSSSMSYKASAGFLDEDGVFHEDVSIILHVGCHQEYTYDPFVKIEQDMKDGI